MKKHSDDLNTTLILTGTRQMIVSSSRPRNNTPLKDVAYVYSGLRLDTSILSHRGFLVSISHARPGCPASLHCRRRGLGRVAPSCFPPEPLPSVEILVVIHF